VVLNEGFCNTVTRFKSHSPNRSRAFSLPFSPADHLLGFLISPSWSEIIRRLRISLRNSATDKFLGIFGKMDGFFILTPWVLTAYILSTHRFFCLLFEHIAMRSFPPPINAPKVPGGGTVGAQYSENHKPPRCLVHLTTRLWLSGAPSAYRVTTVCTNSHHQGVDQ